MTPCAIRRNGSERFALVSFAVVHPYSSRINNNPVADSIVRPIVYMTNLLSQISIILSLVTNWTGVTVGTNELGYVATNHTAELTYRGVKREFHLLSEPSGIAVWRPHKDDCGITNIFLAPRFWTNWGTMTTNWIDIVPLNFTNIRVMGTIEGG